MLNFICYFFFFFAARVPPDSPTKERPSIFTPSQAAVAIKFANTNTEDGVSANLTCLSMKLTDPCKVTLFPYTQYALKLAVVDSQAPESARLPRRFSNLVPEDDEPQKDISGLASNEGDNTLTGVKPAGRKGEVMIICYK